jgi:hypothetical protein
LFERSTRISGLEYSNYCTIHPLIGNMMTTACNFEKRSHIKCPQQISFLKFWERSRGEASLPHIKVLKVEDLSRIADKLMLCHVVREDESLRFLIKFHGKQFELAHGRNCVARYVDEAVAPSLREKARSMYHRVAMSREPMFSSTPIREGNGPIVNYERLLLPFAKTGPLVEYICCIITMITEENGFNFDIAIKGRPIHETT